MTEEKDPLVISQEEGVAAEAMYRPVKITVKSSDRGLPWMMEFDASSLRDAAAAILTIQARDPNADEERHEHSAECMHAVPITSELQEAINHALKAARVGGRNSQN